MDFGFSRLLSFSLFHDFNFISIGEFRSTKMSNARSVNCRLLIDLSEPRGSKSIRHRLKFKLKLKFKLRSNGPIDRQSSGELDNQKSKKSKKSTHATPAHLALLLISFFSQNF